MIGWSWDSHAGEVKSYLYSRFKASMLSTTRTLGRMDVFIGESSLDSKERHFHTP